MAYALDKSPYSVPVEVSPEERGNIALLELAALHRLSVGILKMNDYGRCGSPACSLGHAAEIGIAGLNWHEDGLDIVHPSSGVIETERSYDAAVAAFVIEDPDAQYLFGTASRTHAGQAAIIEAFVAQRRAT